MGPQSPLKEMDEYISEQLSELPSPSDRLDQGTLREEMRELEMKRRRENVHVLIALGVIGAYFSFISNLDEAFLSPTQQTVTLLLVVISGLFLFIKMSTITFRPDIDHRWIDSLDERVAPAMYILSIYGLLIVGVVSWLSAVLPEIPQSVLEGVLFFSLIGLMFGIFIWVMRTTVMNIAEKEEKIQAELTNVLALLQNSDTISEARRNEIIQRFERILGSREEITKSQYMWTIAGDTASQPFVLKPEDRRRIENIIERMKIKMAQNRVLEDDVETLEQLLTDIEER